MYSVTKQFAFVPKQMTVAVNMATSDLLMFHFNVYPANTVQQVGSKWDQGPPDPGTKESSMEPDQQSCPACRAHLAVTPKYVHV